MHRHYDIVMLLILLFKLIIDNANITVQLRLKIVLLHHLMPLVLQLGAALILTMTLLYPSELKICALTTLKAFSNRESESVSVAYGIGAVRPYTTQLSRCKTELWFMRR